MRLTVYWKTSEEQPTIFTSVDTESVTISISLLVNLILANPDKEMIGYKYGKIE